jgi:hypothetical protein
VLIRRLFGGGKRIVSAFFVTDGSFLWESPVSVALSHQNFLLPKELLMRGLGIVRISRRNMASLIGFCSLTLVGCTHEAALEKAIASGDAEKMTQICEGVHFGFQQPPSDATMAQACKAREAYDRAQIPQLSCDQAEQKYLAYFSHLRPPPATSLAFAHRLAFCGRWLALWSIYQGESSGVPPILIREAKTPAGEARLRALIPLAPSWALEEISANLRAVDEASGPTFADEFAIAFDRAPSPEAQANVFKYLVRHKHPRASALTVTYLTSESHKDRRFGCWAVGELHDPALRPLAEQVAGTDSYSEFGEARGGAAVSQRFVVREACRQSLPKVPRT